MRWQHMTPDPKKNKLCNIKSSSIKLKFILYYIRASGAELVNLKMLWLQQSYPPEWLPGWTVDIANILCVRARERKKRI